MLPLKAHFQNGQVVLDESTDLPNGTELYVVSAEQLRDIVLLRDDGLDDDERKRLHESIRRGIKDGRAGRVTDFEEFLDELLQSPLGPGHPGGRWRRGSGRAAAPSACCDAGATRRSRLR